MKTTELNDETYAALQRLAAAKHLTIDELLAALLQGDHLRLDRDPLLFFLAAPQFRSLTDPVERYLALLAWCATNHGSDFADFVSHQESGHRYLMLSPDEVQEVRAHNHARQIDGTQFWAVMTIDAKSQRRFVRRLLEFIGCRDEAVAEACRALGLAADSENSRLLGVA
jgi:hypothetical protein